MSQADTPIVLKQLSGLLERDTFARELGIELISASPGEADVRLIVTSAHMNFLAWTHGGVIFALADTAFGLACNSRDKVSVGIDVHMAYLSGVREGDMIEAHASEISRTRRKAVYRVDVRRPADDTAIATFTGTVIVTEQDVAQLLE
ncbi:MAG: hotdog fold thioesterase [Rhodospirillales bacterium]